MSSEKEKIALEKTSGHSTSEQTIVYNPDNMKSENGGVSRASQTELEAQTLTLDRKKTPKSVDAEMEKERRRSAPELESVATVSSHPARSQTYVVGYSHYPVTRSEDSVVVTTRGVPSPTQTVIVTQGARCSNCRVSYTYNSSLHSSCNIYINILFSPNRMK